MKLRNTARLGTKDAPRAAEMLRDGRLVAFPTETVYGLGANALDEAAVASIFAAKERPGWDPVIVHVSDREMMGRVAVAPEEAAVSALMRAFWPGPLTLLLPRTGAVPENVTAGRELVGVRMPAHPLALDLIRLAGVPVAAPSANRFGRTSPTTAEHVLVDLDGRIDAVLDGGPTSVGVESTVFDVRRRMVYRPGAVTVGMLAAVIGEEVSLFEAAVSEDAEGMPSPGTGLRHYAPRARLILVEGKAGLLDAVLTGVGMVGVMLPEGWENGGAPFAFSWGQWANGEELARRLFLGLRTLDEAGVDVIVCPVPEMGGIGEALRDRLRRAARGR